MTRTLRHWLLLAHRVSLLVGLCVKLGVGLAPAQAQQSQAEAHADGTAFGTQHQAAAQNLPTSAATTAIVPSYQDATAPQSSLFNNPAALPDAVDPNNPAYQTLVTSNLYGPKINPQSVKDTLARGNAINQSPATYAEGLAQGQSGQCVQLPPSTGLAGTYVATCNAGAQVTQTLSNCAVTEDVALNTSSSITYAYYFVSNGAYGTPLPRQSQFQPFLDNGQCKLVGAPLNGCDANIQLGISNNKFCSSWQTQKLQCDAIILSDEQGTDFTYQSSGHSYFSANGTSNTTAASSKNVGQCAALASNSQCTLQNEVCTDASPLTRVFGGIPVTNACWGWTRSYQCTSITQQNDCTTLQNTPGCVYQGVKCLDPVPDPSGACKVSDIAYNCPIPGSTSNAPQYVCGGDLYCVSGNCETITRTPSTEFNDALAALNAVTQAKSEYAATNLTIFQGTGEGCHKPVFGLANCCAGGSGIPVIGTCSDQERLLAAKVFNRLTHYIGSFCSGSFLGICTSARNSYCSFLSKISRLIQEQGRPQLGLTFGTPQNPICTGFTPAQFAALDLSRMNFSELYSDFMAAVKLPDETATITDLQAKIQAYYASVGK